MFRERGLPGRGRRSELRERGDEHERKVRRKVAHMCSEILLTSCGIPSLGRHTFLGNTSSNLDGACTVHHDITEHCDKVFFLAIAHLMVSRLKKMFSNQCNNTLYLDRWMGLKWALRGGGAAISLFTSAAWM